MVHRHHSMFRDESMTNLVYSYLEVEVEEEVPDVDAVSHHHAQKYRWNMFDDGILGNILVVVVALREKHEVYFGSGIERHPVETLLVGVVAVNQGYSDACQVGVDDCSVG